MFLRELCKFSNMGMGTLLSLYPRGSKAGMEVIPYDGGDLSQPLVAPLQAWPGSPQGDEPSYWDSDEEAMSPWLNQNTIPPLK
ncbi:hypothetical protein SK128_012307, partial [Halocaridina rubra]